MPVQEKFETLTEDEDTDNLFERAVIALDKLLSSWPTRGSNVERRISENDFRKKLLEVDDLTLAVALKKGREYETTEQHARDMSTSASASHSASHDGHGSSSYGTGEAAPAKASLYRKENHSANQIQDVRPLSMSASMVCRRDC